MATTTTAVGPMPVHKPTEGATLKTVGEWAPAAAAPAAAVAGAAATPAVSLVPHALHLTTCRGVKAIKAWAPGSFGVVSVDAQNEALLVQSGCCVRHLLYTLCVFLSCDRVKQVPCPVRLCGMACPAVAQAWPTQR